jgi:hypothetical protein
MTCFWPSRPWRSQWPRGSEAVETKKAMAFFGNFCLFLKKFDFFLLFFVFFDNFFDFFFFLVPNLCCLVPYGPIRYFSR